MAASNHARAQNSEASAAAPLQAWQDDPVASLRTSAGTAGRSNRRAAPKIRLGQFAATVVIVALFLTAAVVGGAIGATAVALLAIVAGALLVFRWQALDPRVRIFRAVVVAIAAAVAVSLFLR